MSNKTLYASVTNTSEVLNVTVSNAHNSSMAIATVRANITTCGVGDLITIDLGYSDNHAQVFKGYVKQIERSVPDDTYTLTANDVLTRAVDYFIAPSNPDKPFKRRNIKAEKLVEDLLRLAGLTSFDFDNTYFTLGVNTDIEVKLVSAWDYSKSIADLIAWNLWADETGTIKFENRKPFVMYGNLSQPGDHVDSSIATLTDPQILNYTHSLSEKDLRNRVVVYGAEGIYAEAKSGTSYNPYTDAYESILPSGYYKSAAAASPYIDVKSYAQQAANYNLKLLNRLAEQIIMTVEGDPLYLARKVVTVNEPTYIGVNKKYYIYSADHSWGESGYTVSLDLRA